MYQIDDVEAASLLYILYKRRQRRTKTKTLQPRRYWVHPLNLKRPSEGQFQVNFMTLRSYPESSINIIE